MNNFYHHIPTEFVFGKETENKTGELLKKHGATKVLLHYGGGSVVASGLLERVKKTIDISFVELGGVQPNPVDMLVYKGVELCKAENIDFILAIGGGSVIDSAKAIAMGARYDGDFWDFFSGAKPHSAIPVGTVLTIPAAGSEGSNATVITKTSVPPIKKAMGSDYLKPVFSIMNPELTYTLPVYQTACGVADMMSHVFERYFTKSSGNGLTDELCEAVLRTIIRYAPVAIKEPNNYEARANIMWAGTIAHDGSLGRGRIEDWGTHMLEHELSALYDVAHGAGLAVMFPAWMDYIKNENIALFERFAKNVWGKNTADEGIQALRDFWNSLGLQATFDELGAKKEDIPMLVAMLEKNTGGSFSRFKQMGMEDAERIYKKA